jgi:hypothetical protein
MLHDLLALLEDESGYDSDEAKEDPQMRLLEDGEDIKLGSEYSASWSLTLL